MELHIILIEVGPPLPKLNLDQIEGILFVNVLLDIIVQIYLFFALLT